MYVIASVFSYDVTHFLSTSKQNKPSFSEKLGLFPLTEDEMEDYVLANHPEIRASIEQAYQEFLEGEVTDLDSLIRETEEEIENANI